jgi:hypothetical protein
MPLQNVEIVLVFKRLRLGNGVRLVHLAVAVL